ncbi:hypothetical protein NLG97_g2846 [Lecanicillium saksenae]|uniref:Uncharacterized protein n=1 Tax=Lecanicillium saksenae TaxID=468837 RepID=A0ACC1QZR2_9HYPO|nr:hypothetical protein NLG97_g2846 [Lecanicillium saksenae]
MIISKQLLPVWAASVAAAASPPSVTIDAGTIIGGDCTNSVSVFFKSIPYAQPPINDLRFEPPKAYGKFPNGQLNATSPATACIQFGQTFEAQGNKSEDCLYLDIWAPSNATKDSKLSVKIFVYGGSNTDGGISDSLYDGCKTADDGAILVSINYRLGPLGFMALKSAGIHGNQGIQDLLLGVKWVKDNISAFGGDPDKMVLFGQSAGATDAYIIATLPEAPSLIKSVIAESLALPSLVDSSSVENAAVSYAKGLGCEVADKKCFQSKSVSSLKNAYFGDKYLKTGLGESADISIPSASSHKFWPFVDGTIIPKSPAKAGSKVPMIVGYNQREGMMDTLTKYNSLEAAKSATPAAYTKFLKDNFGPAAAIIEKYYDLSLFKDTPLPVIAAIATIGTDAEYKCTAYQSALQTARNGVPSWVYEFTHNSSCVWLDTMPQEFIQVFGAAHTAELPYIFGNLHFDFANKNTTCTGTSEEWGLSEEMMGLWTMMAEKGSPSTKGNRWPQFRASANGSDVQGMIFGNSSEAGGIDFSACQLWAKLDEMLGNTNVTAPTHSGGATQATGSPGGHPTSLASGPIAAIGILFAGLAVAI